MPEKAQQPQPSRDRKGAVRRVFSHLPFRSLYRRVGRVGAAFAVFLLLYLVLRLAAPQSGWTAFAYFGTLVLFIWLLLRLVRMAARLVVWRLRNRLLVTYLFIAVVPVLLIAALAVLGAWAFTCQVAVYLVTSELDRRIGSLHSVAANIVQADPLAREQVMRRVGEAFFRERFPGVQMVLRQERGLVRFPPDSTLDPPPSGWKPTSGVILKDRQFYGWAYEKQGAVDVTVVAPLTAEYLADLVPTLGVVYFRSLTDSSALPSDQKKGLTFTVGKKSYTPGPTQSEQLRNRLPPPVNRFDIDVPWVSLVSVANWNAPERDPGAYFLVVHTRPSAVLRTLFSSQVDWTQGLLPVFLLIVAVLFLIVELISLVIGVSMTRTITSAVHHLYEGTHKIMEGSFSHRIEVKGNDQLADLGHSFNRMTENLERLLVVAKEKERLQSEIEIAREVQNQLYPKTVPEIRTLRLTAVCQPARMVSGDYYDYEYIQGNKLALAIGDVAGKGISAALLMATLQSSLRAQIHSSLELAAAAGNGRTKPVVSTSSLVCQLNQQLYAYTSPEKYATFYFGVYDESSSTLTYTNAGHLPPILIRDGQSVRLDVNGTVVGAFPFSNFGESSIDLKSGDLLVCFTDGVTEPENEYGEMFGEERLVELVTRNVQRDDEQIVSTVIDAVLQWTGSPELQDDMTILLARRR